MLTLAPAAAPPPDAPATLLELLAWWESRAAGGMPDRRALDPVAIGRHLAYVALLEIEEAGDFRFRLVGDEVRARYGALSGRRLGELLAGRAREEALEEHRACASSRRPTLARRAEPTKDGSDGRRYWRLLLPFGDGGRPTTVLAAMRFDR